MRHSSPEFCFIRLSTDLFSGNHNHFWFGIWYVNVFSFWKAKDHWWVLLLLHFTEHNCLKVWFHCVVNWSTALHEKVLNVFNVLFSRIVFYNLNITLCNSKSKQMRVFFGVLFQVLVGRRGRRLDCCDVGTAVVFCDEERPETRLSEC